jgi:hypothetical protein
MQCAWTQADDVSLAAERCPDVNDGNSKYCKTHKRSAHERWVGNIKQKSSEREQRDGAFADLFCKADEAGRAAAEACLPVPMTVVQRANPFDDNSPIVKSYGPIADGVCGFAWVTIHPGNCPAANFAKKRLGASRGYHGGMEIWVSGYRQSMQLKEAYAQGFTDVLRAAGVTAYVGSRMD